jgi:alanyl-tRNA synthetase
VVLRLAASEGRLAAAARALRCAPAEVPAAAARVAEESQARRKEVEKLALVLAAAEAERLAVAGTGPVVARLEPPLSGAGTLRAVAQALASRGRVALLGGVEEGRAQLCFARPKGPGPHLGELLRDAAKLLGGKGGGSPDLAQGGGPEPGRLEEALGLALGMIGQREEWR